MPVNIDGKTFADHKSAVEHLKKSKPEIKDPDAYVATVERSMKGAKAQRLYARLDNVMESMSDYKSVIDSFKRGESAYGGNYHSDGSTLSLYGHPIAKHNGDKMSVSDAGYPTHTTHKALRRLGVDIKRRGGQTHVHGKPYKSGEFVDVPKSKLAQQLTAEKDTTIDFPPASRYYECATCGDSFDSRDEFNQHKSSSGHPKTGETKQTRESQLKARLQKLAGEDDPNQTYKIVRFYHPSIDKPSRKIKGGLTLEEARAHTNDPSTRKEGEYFDGYDKE